MSLGANRRLVSSLAWTLGVGSLLWLAGSGDAFAGGPVPELDAGGAVSGIALAITAAILLVERYRHRE